MRRKKIEPDLQILFTTYLVWQGCMDEDRTFYSVSENAILGVGNV